MSLTEAQTLLEDQVTQAANADGRDSGDVLAELDAPLADKLAVAEYLGGPGGGETWRKAHAA